MLCADILVAQSHGFLTCHGQRLAHALGEALPVHSSLWKKTRMVLICVPAGLCPIVRLRAFWAALVQSR